MKIIRRDFLQLAASAVAFPIISPIAYAQSTPHARSKLEMIGTSVSPSTPEQLRTFIKAEIDKWEAVVKEPGIRIDG